jgi:hypothetical protein
MAVDAPELVRFLPEVPLRGYGDGYDWMDELGGTRWRVLPNWGRDGWDMGAWPYVIVGTCAVVVPKDERPPGQTRAYGVLVYVEGDREVTAHATAQDRQVRLDEIAAFYWALSQSDGPDFYDPPGTPWEVRKLGRVHGPAELAHTGPFSWKRAEAEPARERAEGAA